MPEKRGTILKQVQDIEDVSAEGILTTLLYFGLHLPVFIGQLPVLREKLVVQLRPSGGTKLQE